MPPKTAIVTGANKGIGLAIVRQLALQYPASNNPTVPLQIYLCARSPSLGTAALDTLLHADPLLTQSKALSASGGPTTIHYHPLDIASQSSIASFAAFLSETHPGGIDILINNAGIALDGFDLNVVQTTLGVNYTGTLALTRALLPLMKRGGRVVNVASTAGMLDGYFSPGLKARFLGATQVDEVTRLMEEFVAAVERGTEKEDGWPSSAYRVSKAGEIAMTRCLAREARDQVVINACCPGWVNTDMTKGKGTKSVDEGAKTPVLLALGDVEGSGRFWRDERVVEWC